MRLRGSIRRLTMPICIALAASLSVNHGVATAAASPVCPPPQTGGAWPVERPERLDLDPERLQRAVEHATTHMAGTFRVYRYGCLAAEGPLNPVTGMRHQNMFSTTKTVAALVLGRAETLGYLKVSDPIGKYFPAADAAHRAVTLRQLLTQTSGLQMQWADQLNIAKPDEVRATLNTPFDHQPGSYFEYNQTPVTLLLAAVQRAVGQDVQTFAQRQLFDKLGITPNDWFWQRDRAGNTLGWAFLYTKPDVFMSRIGALLLNDGSWRGKRVISGSYLKGLRTSSAHNAGYGYLTWLNRGPYINPGLNERTVHQRPPIASAPGDMYMAAGFHGQFIFVIPSLRMVVTRTQTPESDTTVSTGPSGERPDRIAEFMGSDFGVGEHELFRLLMAAVTDVQMPDPGPFDDPSDLNGDPGRFLRDPAPVAGGLGVGPNATPGCDPLGCDGAPAIEGTVATVQDAVDAVLGTRWS